MPHPGLDPFRGRAGRITNAHGRSGLIFVQSSGLVTRLGGHLWWRRWSRPHEFVILHVEYSDGQFDEFWIEDEKLDEEIKSWERNEFHHLPRYDVYHVEWLDDDESARVRESSFTTEAACTDEKLTHKRATAGREGSRSR